MSIFTPEVWSNLSTYHETREVEILGQFIFLICICFIVHRCRSVAVEYLRDSARREDMNKILKASVELMTNIATSGDPAKDYLWGVPGSRR